MSFSTHLNLSQSQQSLPLFIVFILSLKTRSISLDHSLVFPKALDLEVTRLNYQLANTNETGQEVVRHLQDTDQDPSVVIDKVDGVNNQWDQLQTRFLELRNRVGDKVSPERLYACPHVISLTLRVSRFTFHASRLRFTHQPSLFTLHTFTLHYMTI